MGKQKVPWWQQPRLAEVVRRIRGADSQETFTRQHLKGVRIATLSRWENGHSEPSPVFRDILEQLARRRRVSLK